MTAPDEAYERGEKASKEEAEYRKGTPFRRCGICKHMRGQGCEIVAGRIEAYMVCNYFEPRK